MPTSTSQLNRLLGGLPTEEYDRLAPSLHAVALELKQVICERGQPLTHVYLPTTSLISMLMIMEDGTEVEVGSIGREGVAGFRALLGDNVPLTKLLVQVPGEAYRLEMEVFCREARRDGIFQKRLQNYTNAMFAQLAQFVACNILHTVEQRCCRWLLMVRDRTRLDSFPLTHEFLARMLGVRRASVTEVAGALQQAGLIRYRRGEMTILDPQKLEAASCECFRTVKREFDRLHDA